MSYRLSVFLVRCSNDTKKDLPMSKHERMLTLLRAWHRALTGGLQDHLDWLALCLITAVSGHRFGDRSGTSDFSTETILKGSSL